MSSYNDWARLMQSRPLPYFMQSETPDAIDAAPLPYQTQNEAQPYEAAAKAATSVMDVMMEEASGVAEQKRRLQMALVKMQQLKDSGTISQGNDLDFNPVVKGTLEGLSEVTGVAPSGRVMDRLTKLQSPVLRPQEGETRTYPGIPFLPTPLDPTVGMQIPAWLDEATTLAGDIGNTGLAAVDMAAFAPLALKGARALGEAGQISIRAANKPYADMTQAEIKALTPDQQADRMLSTFPEDEIRNAYLQADDATKQTMRGQVMKGREAVAESTATQKPASIFDEFGNNPTRPWDETFRYVDPERFENYRGRDMTPGLHERLLRLDSELRAQEIRDSELLESVFPKNRAAVEDLIINKRNHIAMEIEKWGGEPAGDSMDLAQQVRQIANKYDVKIAGAAKKGGKIEYESGFRATDEPVLDGPVNGGLSNTVRESIGGGYKKTSATLSKKEDLWKKETGGYDVSNWEGEGGSFLPDETKAATNSQLPPAGQSGVYSRLAPASETTIPTNSPYVKAIDSQGAPGIEKVPVDIQKNRFGRETKIFDVVIQPEILAMRPDGTTPISIETWQQARQINTNPSRMAGWQEIYKNARKIENYAGTGGFRRDPAKAGKLVDVEVGKLTEGCQRAATTVERVRHGVLPNETRIEACYGSDCWANKTLASKFGPFENMENRDLALATPEAIEKWFAGNPGQKRVGQLNEKQFIRMGYSGDDSHAIATGIAQKWLEASSAAGVTKKTVFISSGYAPVSDAAYAEMAKHAGKFELHFSNSGWFDKNEIMLRFGEFMAAKENGVPAKLRIITNKDNVSGIKMVNEGFLDNLLKKHKINQNEILETPFHDDDLRINKRSEPSGKYRYVCCETGACKTCGPKCMTNISPLMKVLGIGSVAATGVYNEVKE